MQENTEVTLAEKPRLKFIDLARTIAILMMLEGHFVDLTLADRHLYVGHPIYEVWLFIRGITAPLFLTVSGLIFSYLLLGDKEPLFFKKTRVKKGLYRAGELLFLGYLIQFSILSIPHYFQGYFGSWIFKFHILQCVAVGLFLLIALAALCHSVKKAPRYVCYITAILFFLGLRVYLLSTPKDDYFPEGFPAAIQNILKGPESMFPIAPWLSFILLGGILGTYLRSNANSQKSASWLFTTSGAFYSVYFIGKSAFASQPEACQILAWFTSRAGQVMFILAALRWWEITRGLNFKHFLKIGQETFAIYILHFIILYGGLIGIGISVFYSKKLLPWQAALGAIIFATSHAYFGIWWSNRKAKKPKTSTP